MGGCVGIYSLGYLAYGALQAALAYVLRRERPGA